MKSKTPFIIILLVLAVAIGAAWYMKRKATTPTPPPGTNNVSSPGSPNAPALPASSGVLGATPAHTLGPANAPVHLEEFGDFECPPCALLHPVMEQMHREFGDRVKITFREFPLTQMHPHAVAAASAAEAAGLQGKFWEMHKLLYENQKVWHEAFDVRPIFEGYAKQIGLDVERFKRDINGDAVSLRIVEDGKRGRYLGVKGTPTVYMNGREIPFEQLAPDKLRVLINAALSGSQ